MNEALDNLKKQLCSKIQNKTLVERIINHKITKVLTVPKNADTQIPVQIENMSTAKWLGHPSNSCLEYCVLDDKISIVKLNDRLIGWVENNNLDDMDDDLDEYQNIIKDYLN